MSRVHCCKDVAMSVSFDNIIARTVLMGAIVASARKATPGPLRLS